MPTPKPPKVLPAQVDDASALEALRTQWGNLLLPYLVHEDENITQACEHATSVTKYTPRSQSAHDLQGIGQWLFEQLPTQQQRSLIP